MNNSIVKWQVPTIYEYYKAAIDEPKKISLLIRYRIVIALCVL